jgi:hypothetical protein
MFDKSFIATTFKRGEGYLHSLREANHETREMIGAGLEDKVIERTPLKNVDVAMLFTYMHRRFGLPTIGGDDYKDLSASWLISTPDPDLALMVSPSFAGSIFSFRPVISLPGKDRDELEAITGIRLEELASAYERTLLDLLRPVLQRDMDFNVLGEITDDNSVPEWAEPDEDDDDAYDRLPRYHESCGTPMPEGIFGTDDWQRVLSIFRKQGDGDIASGMRAFVDKFEQDALNVAAGSRPFILPIIAAGLVLARLPDAKTKIERIGISAADPRISEFCQASFGNGLSKNPSDWFLSVSENDILEALDVVKEFGAGTHGLAEAIENIPRSQLMHTAWKSFLEVSGGEFDENLIPEAQYIRFSDVEIWRKNLAASNASVSEWAEELFRKKHGDVVLATILSRLHYQKISEREAATPKP